MDPHHHIGIYLTKESRIRSNFTFTDSFSFFILCRKAPKEEGRFITGKWGNIVLGFWQKMKDVIHMNEFISKGDSADSDALYFIVLRSDRKSKYIYFKNVFEDTWSAHLRKSLPSFGQLVIGEPITFTKESMSGWIYECICFDYFIDDPKEIISFIKKYY